MIQCNRQAMQVLLEWVWQVLGRMLLLHLNFLIRSTVSIQMTMNIIQNHMDLLTQDQLDQMMVQVVLTMIKQYLEMLDWPEILNKASKNQTNNKINISFLAKTFNRVYIVISRELQCFCF